MKLTHWLRSAETVFLAIGTICTSALLGAAVGSLRAQHEAQAFRTNAIPTQRAKAQQVAVDPGNEGSRAYLMGRLEIPSIGISVPILSDDVASSLLKGVGHVPDTAMPGGLGTLGLAGHRDTYFRPLKNIQRNMDIRVVDVDVDGTYHYSVDSTEVVAPENVQVLDVRNRPEMTLITCYPFSFIGAAPKRFIVHAHLVSALPDLK